MKTAVTLPLANQLNLLGTENAFAVSKMAAEWKEKGNDVYAFHLGDLDAMPPRRIIDEVSKAIFNGKNGYCPSAGIDSLRYGIATLFNLQHSTTYSAENIAVQSGGKPVIAKFLMTVMNPGDEVLYPVPGFPIYRSQIDYQNGVAVPYYYRPKADGFEIDIEGLKQSITSKTKAIIFNNYHNPTGACATNVEIDAIADLVQRHQLWLLNDDAYYMVRYDNEEGRSILSRSDIADQTVNLFTFSKQFSMTGWRVGAAIAPTRVIDVISKMNTNIESCTSHFTQEAIAIALSSGEVQNYSVLDKLDDRRLLLTEHLNKIEGVSVPLPKSAFYIYCCMKNLMQRKGHETIDSLMRDVLHKTGVSFCTGEHFGESATTTYARFAFSGISLNNIDKGMERFVDYANQ